MRSCLALYWDSIGSFLFKPYSLVVGRAPVYLAYYEMAFFRMQIITCNINISLDINYSFPKY